MRANAVAAGDGWEFLVGRNSGAVKPLFVRWRQLGVDDSISITLNPVSLRAIADACLSMLELESDTPPGWVIGEDGIARRGIGEPARQLQAMSEPITEERLRGLEEACREDLHGDSKFGGTSLYCDELRELIRGYRAGLSMSSKTLVERLHEDKLRCAGWRPTEGEG